MHNKQIASCPLYHPLCTLVSLPHKTYPGRVRVRILQTKKLCFMRFGVRDTSKGQGAFFPKNSHPVSDKPHPSKASQQTHTFSRPSPGGGGGEAVGPGGAAADVLLAVVDAAAGATPEVRLFLPMSTAVDHVHWLHPDGCISRW